MGKVNPGKRFESKLKASLDAYGYFSLRIPDKVYWTGSRLASEETPADYMACGTSDGRLSCYMIEAKACSRNRMQFSQLKEHQLDALMSFDGMHADMHGVVAVNFYDPVSIKRYDMCFMVPVPVWSEYRDGKMKSISRDECLSDARIASCPKIRGGIYDLSGMEAIYGGSERDGDGPAPSAG